MYFPLESTTPHGGEEEGYGNIERTPLIKPLSRGQDSKMGGNHPQLYHLEGWKQNSRYTNPPLIVA